MKLKDWADKQGISYLTAWRWFKAGDPRLSKAYQSDSGTIIVPDENESSEQAMAGNTQSDAMSIFLKKTVEYSKNNSTVEDFAAYVISNFSLKLSPANEPAPKYSKQKPKAEEVQKHFKQFLPDKEKEEHLKAVKSLIKEQGVVDPTSFIKAFNEEQGTTIDALMAAIPTADLPLKEEDRGPDPMTPEYESMAEDFANYELTKGLTTRSVDLNTTPQQINYTGSNSQIFGGSPFYNDGILGSTTSCVVDPLPGTSKFAVSVNAAAGPYSAPTYAFVTNSLSPETKTTGQFNTTDTDELPRKRGRKPTKKR